MSKFNVGQKVLCLDCATAEWRSRYPANWPCKGQVYTVREINVWPSWIALRFDELDNSHMVPDWSQMEPGFNAANFRPVRNLEPVA